MDNGKTKTGVTVLGVGNILLTDEGVGVRVLQELMETHDFPPGVELVDGGVLGLSLMGVVEAAGRLIVIDAVNLGGAPGDLFRLTWDELTARTRYKDSLHQIDFVEVMSLLPLIGVDPPPTVIVGVQPADVETTGLALTPGVAAKVPDLTAMVLQELENLGFTAQLKERRIDVSRGSRPSA
jgi:hydrogenase maturation protease